MSVPAAPGIAAIAQSGVPLAPLDAALMSLNSNPYFIGMMMLMLNFGGRFLPLEMTKGQEAFFQNTWVRRLLIFIIVFVGTRNVLVAFWMSLAIILCIGYLFNENSSLCLFGGGEKGSTCATTTPVLGGGLTQEETEILKRLTDKQQKYVPKKEETKEDKQTLSEIYWQNMSALNPRF